MAVSTYLTIEHYTNATSFACPETATINCLKVTTSKWSVLRLVRLVGAAAGVLMVIYLVYVELFQVNAICLWCTDVHLLTLILFGAVLRQTLKTGSK